MNVTTAIVITIYLGLAALLLTGGALGGNAVKPPAKAYPVLILSMGLAARLICAYLYKGYAFDMSCFNTWADRLHSNGLAAFYTSGNFNDYPPGYMYILALLGDIKSGMSEISAYVTLKIPAMLSDIAAGTLIYHMSKRSEQLSEREALILTSLYLFNPMVIADSALWGQVDAIYSGLCALMIYLAAEKKLVPSYFAFAAAVLMKPQSFFFMPVLIYAIIQQVFLDGFETKKFFINLAGGLCAAGTVFLLMIPFGIKPSIDQYLATMKSSTLYSQNAFNIWSAAGLNYKFLTPASEKISYILLAAIVAASAFAFFSVKDKSRYYLSGFLLAFLTYMFSMKMHERYGFAAAILVLMVYISRPGRSSFLCYGIVSAAMFLNIAWELRVGSQNNLDFAYTGFVVAASVINTVICTAALAYLLYDYCIKGKATAAVPERSEISAEEV